jgi:hypothetical protein
MSGYILRCPLGTTKYALKETIDKLIDSNKDTSTMIMVIGNKGRIEDFNHEFPETKIFYNPENLKGDLKNNEVFLMKENAVIVDWFIPSFVRINYYFKKIVLIIWDHRFIKDRRSRRAREIQRLGRLCNQRIIITSRINDIEEIFYSVKFIDFKFMTYDDFKYNFVNFKYYNYKLFKNKNTPYRNRLLFHERVKKYYQTIKLEQVKND